MDDGSDASFHRMNGLRRAFQSPHSLANSPLANFTGLALGGRRKSQNPDPIEKFILSNFEANCEAVIQSANTIMGNQNNTINLPPSSPLTSTRQFLAPPTLDGMLMTSQGGSQAYEALPKHLLNDKADRLFL